MTKVSNLMAFLSGLTFSIGLLLSQMVNPLKVQNFLDFFGSWDPSLLLVMVAALTVYWAGYFMVKPRLSKPWCEPGFNLPVQQQPDKSLLWGAVLFGAGWGITGLCPGPALANIPGGEPRLLVFVTVMVVSMKVFDTLRYSGKG